MMPLSSQAIVRSLYVLAVVLALCGVLGGCSNVISRPAPVKGMFLLDPPLPQPAGGTPKAAVLRVGAINVAAPFRGKSFVYRRSDLGYDADYYDEWFVPPNTMLADALARSLAAARVFERVVPAGAAGNEGDYLLDGFVSAMYADARTRGQLAAELAVTFYLTPMNELGGAPVWTHEYRERAPLSADTPEAYPQALNTALAATIQSLARDVAAAPLKR
jgi:cholesterol transport system auxiliary component